MFETPVNNGIFTISCPSSLTPTKEGLEAATVESAPPQRGSHRDVSEVFGFKKSRERGGRMICLVVDLRPLIYIYMYMFF